MTEKDIRPIPKYIKKLIKKADDNANKTILGRTRFYAYLAIWKKELVKVTVAVKTHYSKWLCKQVAVHGIHSDRCFLKDIIYYRISGYSVGWFEQGVGKEPKWYENAKWDWHEDKYFDPYAPIVNMEVIDKLPEYKYSAYKLYNTVEILQYLRLYEKYPQTEYLIKLGLSKFVNSRQILEKMSKDKKFCKWLAQNRADLIRNHYYVHCILQAYSKNRDIKALQAYEYSKKKLQDKWSYREIKELFPDIKEFLDYIAKQKTNIDNYNDYLRACRYLGLDMSIPKNRIPHDFKRWHNIRSDEYATAKAIKDEKERAELYAKFALVAKKYAPLQHSKKYDFICIIAKSPQDLIREGERLDHCVGRMGYDQKFAREETLIFFVREKNEPKTPLVTVEYSIKRQIVLQCYGMGDSRPNANILDYVNNVWLPYANRHIRKIAA